jgi:16S rRNA (guanine(1405)-N(7))-methyltransferase
MGDDAKQLDFIMTEVCKNTTYARMDRTLVKKIALLEMKKRKSSKEVIKATRSKLHQIGTVYLESAKPLVFDWHNSAEAPTADPDFQKSCALHYLAQHTSTKERLPIAAEFYQTIFENLPAVSEIIDLACGLNPLFRPWMPVAADVPYFAYDVFDDVIGLVNAYFKQFNFAGQAAVRDITSAMPVEATQIVFLLKTLPCLEQIQKGIGEKILKGINAENVVVSFPAKSLGGKNKGMVAHYDAYLKSIVQGTDWEMTMLPFVNETVYILKRIANA